MLKGTNDEISAGTGGKLAGPIAKQILDYLFATEASAAAPPTDPTTAASTPAAAP
jgi:hypothetical protein